MKPYAIAIGLILLAVVVLHGPSVRYGLLLDDFNHRAELREGDWSFRSLVEASHLGGHRRRVHMWWQGDADLYFFRPLAFGIMKAEYIAAGWRPALMHLFSLGWSVIAAVLVMLLARNALGSVAWAGLAGVLFAIHPGNYLTGRWIACQNEQMASAFTLAALLFYARYAGWRWTAPPEPRASARAARVGPASSRSVLRLPGRALSQLSCLLAAFLCFVAALGCRESAVMLAPLLVLGDRIIRPQRTRSQWPVYVVLGVILVAYLAARHGILGGFTLPGPPYAYSPDSPGFTRFILDKFVYYILALFACFPIVGFEGLRSLRDVPGGFYGSFAAIVLAWGSLLWLFRRRRSLRFWLLLAVVPLVPVLPVFASAHHLYLASAGMVMACVSVARWIVEWSAASISSIRRWVRGVLMTVIALHLIAFAAAQVVYDVAFAGFSAASQLPVDEVVERAGALNPDDKLFFINLPMIGFNCIPGIEEASGIAPLNGYALTFAPGLLAMVRTGQVQRVGERQLRVRLEGDGYFSGLTGQSMLAAVERDKPFHAGETFRSHPEEFVVKIVRSSEAGIQELLFTFSRPLDDPGYHFFFASPQFRAYPLQFGSWPTSAPSATATHPADTPQTAESHRRNDTPASQEAR